MSTETWEKDSYELIDYEGINFSFSNMQIDKSGFIFRDDDDIYFNENFEENNKELLFQIVKNDTSNYQLIMNELKFNDKNLIESRNSCWFVLKKSKMEDKGFRYKINEGEILRFGLVIVKISKIIIGNNNQNINKSINKSINNEEIDYKENNIKIHKISKKKTEPNLHILTLSTAPDKVKNSNLNKNKNIVYSNKSTLYDICKTKKLKIRLPRICRICYSEEDPLDDLNNPFVEPCQCSGSVKYVHLNCLKEWIHTKYIINIEKNENFLFFIIKLLECDICKGIFPDYIKHKNKIYQLIDFEPEFQNYFIMESLTIDKNKNRFVYVISLDNNKILKLGRGNNSDIIIGDLSVSRVHSILILDNKKIYIEDNNSKFATLILFQSPMIKLTHNLPLYIQIGRTFMDCRIKAPSSIFSCCGVFDTPNMNYYYQQNERKIESKKNVTVKTEIDLDNERDEDSEVINIEGIKENPADKKNLNKITSKGSIFNNKEKLKLKLSLNSNNNDDDKSNEDEQLNMTTYKKYHLMINSNNTSNNTSSNKLGETINDNIEINGEQNESINLENENK